MHHAYGDLFCRQFLQGIAEGFHGSIHITFDNQIEFFEITEGKTAADFIERNMFFGTNTLFPRS